MRKRNLVISIILLLFTIMGIQESYSLLYNTAQISSFGNISYGIIVRKVDFETGDFSQIYQYGGDTNGDVTITTENVNGNYGARCFTSGSDNAAQVRLWGIPFGDYYYGFQVYIPPDYEATEWQMLCEIYPDVPGIYANKHVQVMISTRTLTGVKNELWIGHKEWDDYLWIEHSNFEFPTGRKVFVEVYLKQHATDGLMIVWVDGVEVVRYKGNTMLNAEGDGIQFAVTNYCSTSLPDHYLIVDDIEVNTERILP